MTDLLIVQTAAEATEARRHQCIAELIDGNIKTFGLPSKADSWLDVIRNQPDIPECDQKVVDKALGMLVAVFRSAQAAIANEFSLEEIFSAERYPEMEVIPVDTAAVALAGLHADKETTQAFGRSITMYKQFVANDLLAQDHLLSHMVQILDELPGSSSLHHALVETAKQLIAIDMELVM